MELRAQTQHRLVGGGGIMIALLFVFDMVFAQQGPVGKPVELIKNTRATISETERKQREWLSLLFTINKKVKQIAKRRAELNDKMLEREAKVRVAAQELQDLEVRSENHKGMLNKRLRQLYQDRKLDTFHWLFSAKSPVEMERNHAFLKRLIDSDHQQVKQYIARLQQMRSKRNQLKSLVAGLALMKKQVEAQENALNVEMRQKSSRVSELKRVKDSKLTELKGLRSIEATKELSYAFFERKGTLKPPVEARLAREYGTYVDPQFRFRLMHKGLFYSTNEGSCVYAVFDGDVVLAGELPGYGKTVIVDHGDNYYSVYAFTGSVSVKKGGKVREGDVVAVSGGNSPLFGPGLYFEIRHFTDAIDPRSWIKDSLMKTVQLRSGKHRSEKHQEKSWDVVSGAVGQ